LKKFENFEKNVPQATFTTEFLHAMMNKPELIRNVINKNKLGRFGGTFSSRKNPPNGHLRGQHPSILNQLFRRFQIHRFQTPLFLDSRIDEQERKISLKCCPMSLILPDSREKSYLINLFDTPGHPNFSDEMCSALRVCDGAVLVVDCIEGVMMQTENIIR